MRLPTPIPVSAAVRDRLTNVLAAIVCDETPEQIAGELRDGFGARVAEMLARPHELDEMRDHVDVLLSVLQAPALTVAG